MIAIDLSASCFYIRSVSEFLSMLMSADLVCPCEALCSALCCASAPGFICPLKFQLLMTVGHCGEPRAAHPL